MKTLGRPKRLSVKPRMVLSHQTAAPAMCYNDGRLLGLSTSAFSWVGVVCESPFGWFPSV